VRARERERAPDTADFAREARPFHGLVAGRAEQETTRQGIKQNGIKIPKISRRARFACAGASRLALATLASRGGRYRSTYRDKYAAHIFSARLAH
jgi:hypothetical protein